MKYSEGNTVLLYDGRTAYIMSVKKDEKKYLVTITDDNSGKMIEISESKIYMKLT